MKLQKIRYLLLGLGFFWIFLSTVLGGLIGAKINSYITISDSPTWLQSMEKALLISAHSHLNLMAIVMILIGLSVHYLWESPFFKVLSYTIWANLVSVPIFILGLICKALSVTSIFYTGVVAFAAVLYIISISIYASLFLYKAFLHPFRN